MPSLPLEYNIAVRGEERLKRVFRTISQEAKAHAKTLHAAAKPPPARQSRGAVEAKKTEAATKKALRDIERAEYATRKRVQSFNLRQLRQETQAKRRAIRELEREQKAASRRAAKAASTASAAATRITGGAGRIFRNTSGRLVGAGRSALGMAGIVGGFAAANAVREQMGIGSMSAELANRAAVVPGERRSRQQLQGSITGAVHHEAEVSGRAPSEVFESLNKFFEKTGNLEGGLRLLPKLNELADAVGLSADAMGTLGQATGIVFAGFEALGATGDEAAKQTAKVMQTAAMQSAIGQIGVEDLAKTFPKIVAAASRVGGDVAQNIGVVTGLANISVATVSADPEEATTSAQRFTDDLIAKAKKLKQLYKVDVFDKGGNLNDLTQLVPQIVESTGGDLTKIQKLFGVRGRRIIEPFATRFRNAPSAEEGRAGVRDMLSKFIGVQLSDEQRVGGAEFVRGQEGRQIGRAMNEFNKELGTKLLPIVTKELIPAMVKLTPHLADLAEAAAGVAEYLSENPLKGIGAIIAASLAMDIAAAGIGAAVSSALTGLIARSIGGAVAGQAAGSAVGAVGATGAAAAGGGLLARIGGRAAGAVGAAGAGLAAAGTAGMAAAGGLAAAGVGLAGYQGYKFHTEGGFGALWEAMTSDPARTASGDDYDELMRRNNLPTTGNDGVAAAAPENTEAADRQMSAADKQLAAAEKYSAAADKMASMDFGRRNSPIIAR